MVSGATAGGGGRREKREGDGERKDRYWSTIYKGKVSLNLFCDGFAPHLRNEIASAVLSYGGSKLFKEGSGQGFHEVEMKRLVKALL